MNISFLEKGLKSRATRWRLQQRASTLARLLFLSVVAFTILYPFITKMTSMFMSETDLMDSTVKLIAKHPTLDNIRFVVDYIEYGRTLLNTTLVSLISAVCSVLCACLVGWGLARYSFLGSKLLFAIVIFITILPPQTVLLALYTKFRDFDVLGIFRLMLGHPLRLVDSYWPMVILSATGMVFRGGLFIFIMRQFYTGIPKELVEAARIDGCGHMMTFWRIVLPLSRAMAVTVFLFGFCWMWSDTVYSSQFYSNIKLFANQVATVAWVDSAGILYNTRLSSVMVNTSVLLSMLPLLLIYLVLQKSFVEGIARSGIVG